MSVPVVRLGEVADVNWGDTSVTKSSYVDDGFTAYSATGADGFLPYADYDQEGIVLSAIGARCGKIWFAEGKWSCIKNTIRYWSTDKRLDNRYLYWVTNREDYFPKRGAAQPFITIGDARNTRISLPPLPEQRRIAAILDKADALRRKRRRSIELLDGLTQSIFLEMFGDPVSNPKAWPITSLGLVTEFYSGNSLPVGEKYKSQPGGYLLLKVSDLNRDGNEEFISGSAEWSPTPGAKAGTCYSNAVVFPKRGGAIATNKKRKLVRPAILDPNLMAVAPKKCGQISIDYLFAWFKNFRLEDISSGSSVPQLNKQDLSPLNICLPPHALQVEFSEISRAIAAKSAVATIATEATDILFTSLQRRAFSGQL